MTKIEALKQLKRECVDCRRCEIGGQHLNGCITNVLSNMCLRARIMVVGQNPGEQEVAQGRPFVGPSGVFFDRAIRDVLGIDRKSLYITNTVHCYTPGNRTPTAVEVANCRDFLDREVAVVKPRLLVALGSPALDGLTNLSGIMRRCGRICQSIRYALPVLPLLHPSPLNMNKADRRKMFYDGLESMRPYLNGMNDG